MMKKFINSQKADFLVVKLVNMLEIKDLKINLANKKVY